MIRVNHWATTALSASFLLLALLIACTRVIHAEPAVAELRTVPAAQTAEKAASPASLSGSPDQSLPATLQPADEASLGKAKPTKQTEATEPLPLSKVVDYLHVHNKNTTINNHKIEKRLIGRVYEGIVKVLDVSGDEKHATVVTPDFYFEITKPEIIEKAAELPKGAKVSITAKLKWFTYESSTFSPSSPPTGYLAVFDDPQNMEIVPAEKTLPKN